MLSLGLEVRMPFCILNVLGDVLDDGELLFVEAAQTLESAQRRIETLDHMSPGQYVIYNTYTGERLTVAATPKGGLFMGTNRLCEPPSHTVRIFCRDCAHEL